MSAVASWMKRCAEAQDVVFAAASVTMPCRAAYEFRLHFGPLALFPVLGTRRAVRCRCGIAIHLGLRLVVGFLARCFDRGLLRMRFVRTPDPGGIGVHVNVS